jgi:peptidoglycan hydrolase CwlO-like protein
VFAWNGKDVPDMTLFDIWVLSKKWVDNQAQTGMWRWIMDIDTDAFFRAASYRASVAKNASYAREVKTHDYEALKVSLTNWSTKSTCLKAVDAINSLEGELHSAKDMAANLESAADKLSKCIRDIDIEIDRLTGINNKLQDKLISLRDNIEELRDNIEEL